MTVSQRLALGHGKNLNVALSFIALGLVALAGLVAHGLVNGNNRRTSLLGETYLDASENPYAGSGKGGFLPEDTAPMYYGLNPDEPGRPGTYAWSTTMTEDKDVTNGHNNNWIYDDGWKNPGHVIKGPGSYYYNEWESDENNQPQADVINELSNPDHTTTTPYSYASSNEVFVGPQAVNQITAFDDYITNSNGVY